MIRLMAKFSEDVCRCIVENYSEGLTISDCADIAGVARETVHRWMKKGENARSGKYKQFYIDMLRARAKFKKHHQRKIADSNSWMASQYLLQVTDPETYVIAEKQQIEAETKSTIQAEVDMSDPRIQEQDLLILKELIGDKSANNSGGDKPTAE